MSTTAVATDVAVTGPAPTQARAVAAMPPHLTWPSHLKAWLLYRSFARRCLPWITGQDVWVKLLRDEITGAGSGSAHPNPYGVRGGATGDAAFQAALAVAERWQAAERPMPELQRP